MPYKRLAPIAVSRKWSTVRTAGFFRIPCNQKGRRSGCWAGGRGPPHRRTLPRSCPARHRPPCAESANCRPVLPRAHSRDTSIADPAQQRERAREASADGSMTCRWISMIIKPTPLAATPHGANTPPGNRFSKTGRHERSGLSAPVRSGTYRKFLAHIRSISVHGPSQPD